MFENYHDTIEDDEEDKTHLLPEISDQLKHNDIMSQLSHGRRRRKIKDMEGERQFELVPGFYYSLETLCETINSNLPTVVRLV